MEQGIESKPENIRISEYNDWIFTKCYHEYIISVGNGYYEFISFYGDTAFMKSKKLFTRDFIAEVTRQICHAAGHRRLLVVSRDKNRDFKNKYICEDSKVMAIVSHLSVENFCDGLDDLKTGETLYVYGITVRLEERFGGSSRDVPIYIKVRLMKRIVDGEMVEGILISFHEQEYPLVPYFQ